MEAPDKVKYLYSSRLKQVILLFQSNRWPARNQKAKGFFSMEIILSRPVTPDEAEELKAATMLRFTRYVSWDGLIEDEKIMGVPDEIIQKLREFSINHPLSGQFELEQVAP